MTGRESPESAEFNSIVGGSEFSETTALDHYFESAGSLRTVIGDHLVSSERFGVEGRVELHKSLLDAAEKFAAAVSSEKTQDDKFLTAAGLLHISFTELRAFYRRYIGERFLLDTDDLDEIQVGLREKLAMYIDMGNLKPYATVYIEVHKETIYHFAERFTFFNNSPHDLNHKLPVGMKVYAGKFEIPPDMPLS